MHAKSRSSLEVGSDLKDLAGPAPLPVKCRLDGRKFLDVGAGYLNASWGMACAHTPGQILNMWTNAVANGDLARANFSGDYNPSLLRTERLGGEDHHVLELTAVDRGVTTIECCCG